MWIFNLVLVVISQTIIMYVTDCSMYLYVRQVAGKHKEYLGYVLLMGILTVFVWYTLDDGDTMLLALLTMLLVVSTAVSGININGGVKSGKREN